MREVDTVARAHQVVLADSAVVDIMTFLGSVAESGTTPLQRDIAGGRPSEWNGAVVRLAKERGVDTPAHELIYHSLLPLELRARGKLVFPT